MLSRNSYIKLLKSNAKEIKDRFGITSMRLFGSVARDEHHEGSDIDVFVTMPTHFYNHVAAANYLEELLGCHVDLVQEHRNMRPFFRKQIERDGITIF